MGELDTKVSPLRTLVVSAAGAETRLLTGATTAYNPGVPSGTDALKPRDLIGIPLVGEDPTSTKANGVVLTCYATGTDDNTIEMEIYGIADGDEAAPERIADLVWILGTARHTSTTILWADTCTITADYHTSTVTKADSGNNVIAKLMFDTSGYRYLYAIAYGTATGAATNITVLMRSF
jgi:hypothetical protein